MIGLTPAAASNALDSLKLLEIAADPKKLRQAVESLQKEQAEIQTQIEVLRKQTQDNERAAKNAEAAESRAASALAEAEKKIKQAEVMLKDASDSAAAVKAQREQLQRDLASLEQQKLDAMNAIANANKNAETAKAESLKAIEKANKAAESAAAREEAARSKEKDLLGRLQTVRDIFAGDLKA